MHARNKRTYRIILIGNLYVGKTALLNQLTEGDYKENYKATLGVDFKTKEVNVNNTKENLEIWDTAGQERFKSLTRKYYQKADGIVIAFSVDDSSSFNLLDSWLEGAQCNTTNASFIIAGCKCDINNHKREVSKQEAVMFAQKHGLQYIETSAKNNTNVELLFEELTRTIKAREERDGVNVEYEFITISDYRKQNKGCCE